MSDTSWAVGFVLATIVPPVLGAGSDSSTGNHVNVVMTLFRTRRHGAAEFGVVVRGVTVHGRLVGGVRLVMGWVAFPLTTVGVRGLATCTSCTKHKGNSMRFGTKIQEIYIIMEY